MKLCYRSTSRGSWTWTRLSSSSFERSKKSATFYIEFFYFQVTALQEKLKEVQISCARTKEEVVLKAIDELKLDINLKENILSTIQAAKTRPNGVRYTQTWIYECILLKIKSRHTYEHLRNHKLMALPSSETIRRYLRKLKPAYGFQSGIFDMLAEKGKDLDLMEKEGIMSNLINT